MPMQEQPMSSFAKRLGARVAEANAQHRDKPVDTGNRRLPAGIRAGVAKLNALYTKVSENEDGKTPKGEVFFRGSAIVMGRLTAHGLTTDFNGENIEGLITQVVIPLCDVPAKGQRKAKPFLSEDEECNWYDFQNLFKVLGIQPAPYDKTTDPTGKLTEQYYFAAMKGLIDPHRVGGPVYIEFSTRGWTPPKSPANQSPNEMVFETWHGLVDLSKFNGQHDPAAGMMDSTPGAGNGAPPQMPPTIQERMSAPPPATTQPAPVTTTYQTAPATQIATAPVDQADLVDALVETAMGDPEGATPEGQEAATRLEELAWANGWTKEQTGAPPPPFTNDWAGVGDMVLNKPPSASAAPAAAPSTPTIPGATAAAPTPGSKWRFAKRTKEGEKLKNTKGEEFPPQEVEVVTVDAAAKTCTVKTLRDGKDVVDIRTKAPVAVKWEWLETIPY